MLILRTAPPSPFGRQIKIAAYHLGLMDRITVEAADTTNPNDSLRKQNPLGKIPILIDEDGTAIYDSKVILEYLDDLAGGNKIIPSGKSRFSALIIQSLANGIIDASILQVYEKRFREEKIWDQDWMQYQADKVSRGLSSLEACPPPIAGAEQIHIGHIALATALGYQDLRFAGSWRETYPHLVNWLGEFRSIIPAFDKTHIQP